MNNKLISIVIPVYNGGRMIARVLESVSSQDYQGDIEIIVVDDGSTDDTPDKVKAFDHVRYLRQENAGPATARNYGARIAQGEVVFFTDSDCIPGVSWVSGMLACFKDAEVGVVTGSYSIANPDFLLARCIQQEIMYRHERRMPKYPKFFGSYNFCVKKKIFWDIGGFNVGYKNASGEDNDLSYKILKAGHKIYFDLESKVQHYHTVSVIKYLKEQFRHGFWRVKMYMEHPKMSKGDDYTFWKDISEPILVSLIFAGILFDIFGWAYGFDLAGGAFIILLVIELGHSFYMMKHVTEKIYFSFVMTLRSLARTLGFYAGLLWLPWQKQSG